MPEIKIQSPGSNPDIAESLIHIPDDSDLGTGTYKFTVSPHALKPDSLIVASIVKPPVFQVTVTVTNSASASVLLGRTDDDRAVPGLFRLPNYVKRNIPHTFEVQFISWRICSLNFDGVPLKDSGATTH